MRNNWFELKLSEPMRQNLYLQEFSKVFSNSEVRIRSNNIYFSLQPINQNKDCVLREDTNYILLYVSIIPHTLGTHRYQRERERGNVMKQGNCTCMLYYRSL